MPELLTRETARERATAGEYEYTTDEVERLQLIAQAEALEWASDTADILSDGGGRIHAFDLEAARLRKEAK